MSTYIKVNDHWVCVSGTQKFTHSVKFDSATFTTDPTACLTYGDDCARYSPVDNTDATALRTANQGSWTDGEPLIDSMFYATFSEGTIHHILDPTDLTKDVNGVDRSQEIQQENVMLVIPTLYTETKPDGYIISNKRSNGHGGAREAYAHTYDGHRYKYLAVGVYEGAIQNGILKSVSGVEPTYSQNRVTFRNAAQANGDNHMLTNFYVNRLQRMLGYMFLKSFDSQRRLGQGYSTGGANSDGNRACVTGLGNKLGRFAGNPAAGTKVDAVKCMTENTWASKWEFLDDVVSVNGAVYLGQRLEPVCEDSSWNAVTTGMTQVGMLYNSGSAYNGWSTAIQTDNDRLWGVFDNNRGTDATGLCDYHWYNTGTRLCLAGGRSRSGSSCGLGCLHFNSALSNSSWDIGARLAFVFD